MTRATDHSATNLLPEKCIPRDALQTFLLTSPFGVLFSPCTASLAMRALRRNPACEREGKHEGGLKLCASWDFLKSSRSSELFSLEWRGVPTRQSEGTLSPSPGSTATARVDALAVRERVVARYMSRASSERSWAASRPGGAVFVVSSLLCNSMYANSIRSESAYRLEFHHLCANTRTEVKLSD